MIRTYRALSALLTYPTAELAAATGEIEQALAADGLIPAPERAALRPLLDGLRRGDLLDAQERYVDLFDRCPSLSLHLFQHVHGDSRDRGQAMIELGQLYSQHGLEISTRELPDFLPLYLEFLAEQPPREACSMLQDVGTILNALHGRLVRRQTPYAAPIAALLAIAGIEPETPAVADEDQDSPEALDRAWEDREVRFTAEDAGTTSGCSKAAAMVRRMETFVRGDTP